MHTLEKMTSLIVANWFDAMTFDHVALLLLAHRYHPAVIVALGDPAFAQAAKIIKGSLDKLSSAV